MKRIGILSMIAAASLLAGCIMFPPEKPEPAHAAPSPRAVLREHPPQADLAPHEAPQASTPAPTDEANACHAERYQGLVGQTLTDANRSILPPNNRVICMGCMATMDFSAERLTIQLGPNNTIASVRCG